MRLDIDDNNLHNLLQEKKDHIGGSWINEIVNIGGGLSFIVTLYSAYISSLWVKFGLYAIASLVIGLGCFQLWKKTGKRSYNYEKLYDDIKNLSTSDTQYSLVAIMNDFEGDFANRVLLQFFQGKWQTYMFLSYRTALENDENNVISRVAASLKIERSCLSVKFLTEELCQPKYSPDRDAMVMYHNRYYQVSINGFSDILKQPEFTLDGVKYKWMTLDEMLEDSQIKKNNLDVLSVFERYIFNIQTKKMPADKTFAIPENVFIRLNRVCNLSCQFCLAEKMSPGLSTDQIKTILGILKSHGIKKAKLTGGEPTLRPDFFEIIEYSIRLGLSTIVYSNLYIAEDIVNRLAAYPVSVSTSIHGDANFHDGVTKKGAYKKTYANILKLTLAHVPVTLHMVLMNKNFNLAETVIKDAINAGVEKVVFQTLIPREKGAEFFANDENKTDIQDKLELLYPLKAKYESKIQIKFSNLYEKGCYVIETDGAVYLEKEDSAQDIFIRGLL